jgi:hypothetical protein
MNYGVIIKLDYKKAQDKIRMFKWFLIVTYLQDAGGHPSS